MNELEIKVANIEEDQEKLAMSLSLIHDVLSRHKKQLELEVATQIKEEMATCKEEIISDVMVTVNNSMDEKLNERGLSKRQSRVFRNARGNKVREMLGGDKESMKYILFSPIYFGSMQTRFRKKFNVDSYDDISPTQLPEALQFVDNFHMNYDWCVETVDKDYNRGLLNKRRTFAYKSYYKI